MLALALLTLSLFPDPLPDAHRFGVSFEVAHVELMRTVKHQNEVVRHFPQDAWAAWGFRQDCVKAAWQLLRKALDTSEPLEDRTKALNELRRNIDSEAYLAGWMPAPIPNYGNHRPWAK